MRISSLSYVFKGKIKNGYQNPKALITVYYHYVE